MKNEDSHHNTQFQLLNKQELLPMI